MSEGILQKVRRRISRDLATRFVTRPCVSGLQGRFLSICFDDFPVSAATTGMTILEEYGARGTYYFAGGLAGTSTAVGPIAGEDAVKSLIERGHEIGCHTFGHVPCSTLSKSQLVESLRANQQAIGFCRMETFAYPFGYFDWTAKVTAAARFKTVRTGIKGVNRGRLDLVGLKAVPLYQPMGDDGLDRWLGELADVGNDAWLILYTHDVQDQPSPFGCTPELLTRCLKRARTLGVQIDPVGTVAMRLAGAMS